jgi:hypothetical protein
MDTPCLTTLADGDISVKVWLDRDGGGDPDGFTSFHTMYRVSSMYT